MGSLTEELRRREAAARAEADRLRTRIEELAEDLARALQDHYSLRSLREEHQARAHPAPVTGADGITRARLETGEKPNRHLMADRLSLGGGHLPSGLTVPDAGRYVLVHGMSRSFIGAIG